MSSATTRIRPSAPLEPAALRAHLAAAIAVAPHGSTVVIDLVQVNSLDAGDLVVVYSGVSAAAAAGVELVVTGVTPALRR